MSPRPGDDELEDDDLAVLADLAPQVAAAAHARDILAEVRRLVDGLRPADLDQLGLAGAIRAQAMRLGLQASVDAPELGSLPAATEVSAYRIVAAALTNVHRHAGATTCSVSMRRDDDLEIEVVDDGRGVGRPSRDGAVGSFSAAGVAVYEEHVPDQLLDDFGRVPKRRLPSGRVLVCRALSGPGRVQSWRIALVSPRRRGRRRPARMIAVPIIETER